jgi:hypothetical protein
METQASGFGWFGIKIGFADTQKNNKPDPLTEFLGFG